MLDTVGAGMQVVYKSGKAISLEANAQVVLTPDQGQEASLEILPINFDGLAKAVKKGDIIFIGQYLFTGSETTSVWLEVAVAAMDCQSLDVAKVYSNLNGNRSRVVNTGWAMLALIDAGQVAAFRATLEEIAESSLLVHVVDIRLYTYK
ncbi:pyruvate kinase 1, cytosolic isoform X2 [Cajanus cajan]|uniref:pyruvate kinase 1, cytosolic isoform X2 n=1 Tax=Cajanus cajan TaxID=3821 RepID=UPI0010FB28B7|nr:pyruvate kinase 1, cytosolic isoform X2 [Cajanus cajan]